MEDAEKQGQKEKYSLADFREEISEIIKKQSEEGEFADFQGVEMKPDDLDDADKDIWMKVKDNSITMMNVQQYKLDVEKNEGFDKDTRYYFMMFVSNKANAIFLRRELEEKK